MAQSQPFARSNGEAADLLIMSTPVSALAQARTDTSTPNGSRAKGLTKLPGNNGRIDTERIQTSHNSTIAGTTSTIGQEAALSDQPFSTHVDERKDVFGGLGHSVLTAPVGGGGGGGGTRFPP